MIKTSSNFLNSARMSGRENIDAYCYVGGIKLTTQEIRDFTVEYSLGMDSVIGIGSCPSQTLNISLFRVGRTPEYYNIQNKIQPFIGFQIFDDNGNKRHEYVKLGTFYLPNSESVTKNDKLITIQCFDRMAKMGEIEVDYNNEEVPSGTVEDVCKWIEKKANIKFKSYPEGNVPKSPAGHNIREVLQELAFITATNCIVNRDDEFEFVQPREIDPVEFRLRAKNATKFQFSADMDSKVARIKVHELNYTRYKEEVDDKAHTYEYVSDEADDATTGIEFYTSLVESVEQVQAIYDMCMPYEYWNYTMELQGQPQVEMGDIIQFVSKTGNEYNLIVGTHKLTYDGGCKSVFNASGKDNEYFATCDIDWWDLLEKPKEDDDDDDDEPYVLPIASETRLGGIRVGNNLEIDPETGILDAVFDISAAGGGGGYPIITYAEDNREEIGSMSDGLRYARSLSEKETVDDHTSYNNPKYFYAYAPNDNIYKQYVKSSAMLTDGSLQFASHVYVNKISKLQKPELYTLSKTNIIATNAEGLGADVGGKYYALLMKNIVPFVISGISSRPNNSYIDNLGDTEDINNTLWTSQGMCISVNTDFQIFRPMNDSAAKGCVTAFKGDVYFNDGIFFANRGSRIFGHTSWNDDNNRLVDVYHDVLTIEHSTSENERMQIRLGDPSYPQYTLTTNYGRFHTEGNLIVGGNASGLGVDREEELANLIVNGGIHIVGHASNSMFTKMWQIVTPQFEGMTSGDEIQLHFKPGYRNSATPGSIWITNDGNWDDDGNYSITNSNANALYVMGTIAYATSFQLDHSISTSDRDKKNTISDIDDKYSILFDNLKPSTFKYNHGQSDRLHVGFIAQDVKDALDVAGLTTQDFGGYCEYKEPFSMKPTDKITCGLRYEEFIALNIKETQKLKNEVKELKETVKLLLEQINSTQNA